MAGTCFSQLGKRLVLKLIAFPTGTGRFLRVRLLPGQAAGPATSSEAEQEDDRDVHENRHGEDLPLEIPRPGVYVGDVDVALRELRVKRFQALRGRLQWRRQLAAVGFDAAAAEQRAFPGSLGRCHCW